MQARALGQSGIQVGAIGLGCMGMSWAYAQADSDDARSIAVIHRALERGATLIDTADVYGPYTNEALVGRALEGPWRQRAVVATKVGLVHADGGSFPIRPHGRPDHVRRSCDASLARLGVDVIDLYQLHRVDPEVPLEETWGAMADLVAAGKVRALGLSEVTVEQIERARRIHPVASVQSELSLWTRDFLGDVLPWCAANGVAFIAYSPLGRGFLTGRFASAGDLGEGDWRRTTPRFQDEALAANLRLVEAVRAVAARRGVTPAQVALAWVLARGAIAIPGTRSEARLDENLAAADVRLSDEELAALDRLPDAVGARYPASAPSLPARPVAR
jgi:aryl-alcohol dehydrogenase-like predicted oxidoreductase